MLSLTVNTPATATSTTNSHRKTPFSITFIPLYHPRFLHPPSSHHKPPPKLVSATLTPNPPPPPQQQLYQPFRPPPSPLPSQFRHLDAARRLDILSNRLGLWFELAPLIPSLYHDGFTPPSIEEATGISGIEQNRLVVAAQVRDSLLQSNTDPDMLSFFDNGGAELLYEIRLLSATQRAAAVRYVVEHSLDAKGAQDLARAMKDFPRRRGDKGWESFNYSLPGDCLSFMYYRQSREPQNKSPQRMAALESALGVAESETAKTRIVEELEGESSGGKGREGEIEDRVRVPVVRMKMGEVAESTVTAVLPVCRAVGGESEVQEAPWECGSEGEFGVVTAEKGWKSWVVLPGWEPVAGLAKGGVVVLFPDARVLPWKVNRWYKEEAILVVADRSRKVVTSDDGFYLVAVSSENGSSGGGLKVEKGSALKQLGVKEGLGTVLLVVRPPREETDDQLSDEDWE